MLTLERWRRKAGVSRPSRRLDGEKPCAREDQEVHRTVKPLRLASLFALSGRTAAARTKAAQSGKLDRFGNREGNER